MVVAVIWGIVLTGLFGVLRHFWDFIYYQWSFLRPEDNAQKAARILWYRLRRYRRTPWLASCRPVLWCGKWSVEVGTQVTWEIPWHRIPMRVGPCPVRVKEIEP